MVDTVKILWKNKAGKTNGIHRENSWINWSKELKKNISWNHGTGQSGNNEGKHGGNSRSKTKPGIQNSTSQTTLKNTNKYKRKKMSDKNPEGN